MTDIYEMQHQPDVEQVIEDMRKGLAHRFGVTVSGNRCTLRWYMDSHLVQVHMVITDVTTPNEAQEDMVRLNRMQALFKKYPDLQEELYYVEHGEHSQ